MGLWVGAGFLFNPPPMPGCSASSRGWVGAVPCRQGEQQDSVWGRAAPWDRAGAGVQRMESPHSQQSPAEQLCKGHMAAGLCWVGGFYWGPLAPELLWL